MPAAKPNTFLDRLKASATKNEVIRPSVTHRAEVLLAAADVSAAMAQGFSLRVIYEQLQAERRISCSYVWFTRLVRACITSGEGAAVAKSS
jgi:hypothetical protein